MSTASDPGSAPAASRPARRRRRGRKRAASPVRVMAALDLGSNNCRLLIATALRGNLRVLHSFSRVVRLGEGVTKSGNLLPAAMDRAIEALKICAQRMEKFDVRHVRAIATEACRQAVNAHVLVERAAAETGITLEIVSADEEARLAAAGCVPLIGAQYGGALIFDIGGGSTEIIWVRKKDGAAKTIHAASVPIGVITLAEQHGGEMNARETYAKMCEEMTQRFGVLHDAMDGSGAFAVKTHHLLGTSGTVTTLAAVALGLDRYDRAIVDASWHKTGDIVGVANRLAGMDADERAQIKCIGTDRADLVLPGCAIFHGIEQHWPCAQLRVADRGLREGMLRELMMDAGARA